MNKAPILDTTLADEFFVVSSPEDVRQVRAMVEEFIADVGPRFAGLFRQIEQPTDTPESVRRALHQLRGVVANFACSSAAARLQELERGWGTLPTEEIKNHLQAAEADMQAGIEALRNRYPFLA